MSNKNILPVSTKDIPKVTLHEHLEGTVTPDMAKKLARRHKVKLPDNLFMKPDSYDQKDFPNGRYAYDETSFVAFLDTYNIVSELVKTPQDYYDITKDYLTKNAKEGGVYVEFILSPAHMAVENDEKTGETKLSAKRYQETLHAIEKASKEVNEKFGLETVFIATGVRNLGAENVEKVVEFIRDNPHHMIKGFGIAGNEAFGTFDDFAKASKTAADIGLKKAYHAGEITGPETIKDALRHGACRIGHGITVIKNEELLSEVAKKQIMFEVCLTSNRILVPEVKGELKNHPVRKMYDAGLKISLNPDDAGIFGTHIGKEYQIAQKNFTFLRAELFDISLNGIEAAFTDEKVIASLKRKIFSKMTAKDKAEMNKLAMVAKNTELKKRLNKRVNEIKSFEQSLEKNNVLENAIFQKKCASRN